MDENMEMCYGSSDSSAGVDEVEVWTSSEMSVLPVDAASDVDSLPLDEQEEDYDVPDDVPEMASAQSGTYASLDSEKVQVVVDAFMESDQVNELLRSLQDTLETVSFAVTSMQEELEDRQEPLEVVPVEDVMERMAAQSAQVQPVQAAAEPVRASPAAVADGEVLVPGSEELAVIELVQELLSYFQEDDNDLLTAIRDNTAAVKTKVIEIAENTAVRPLMETPFEEYSVLEGLLLLLVIWLAVINPCIRMIKGGFSWLTW